MLLVKLQICSAPMENRIDGLHHTKNKNSHIMHITLKIFLEYRIIFLTKTNAMYGHLHFQFLYEINEHYNCIHFIIVKVEISHKYNSLSTI